MTADLALFSDWALALLPRLFLYPGGAWLLAAVLLLRAVTGGTASIRPRALLYDLGRSDLLALSLAWAAVALVPLPGTSPLPLPADRLSVVLLLLGSLALDLPVDKVERRRSASTASAVTLALLAPAVATGRLLVEGGEVGPAWWLGSGAVIAGLMALAQEPARSLAAAVRWVAWLGLAAAPVWAFPAPVPLPAPVFASVVLALGIVVVGLGRRMAARSTSAGPALEATAWGLAGLSLLTALLT